jgi:hypothetical protein
MPPQGPYVKDLLPRVVLELLKGRAVGGLQVIGDVPLKGTVRHLPTTSPFPFLSLVPMSLGKQFWPTMYFHHSVLPHYMTKAMGANQSWTGTFKTMS